MNSWQHRKGRLADEVFDRRAMWQRIDEATERMERESWEATLAAIKALPVVSR